MNPDRDRNAVRYGAVPTLPRSGSRNRNPGSSRRYDDSLSPVRRDRWSPPRRERDWDDPERVRGGRTFGDRRVIPQWSPSPPRHVPAGRADRSSRTSDSPAPPSKRARLDTRDDDALHASLCTVSAHELVQSHLARIAAFPRPDGEVLERARAAVREAEAELETQFERVRAQFWGLLQVAVGAGVIPKNSDELSALRKRYRPEQDGKRDGTRDGERDGERNGERDGERASGADEAMRAELAELRARLERVEQASTKSKDEERAVVGQQQPEEQRPLDDAARAELSDLRARLERLEQARVPVDEPYTATELALDASDPPRRSRAKALLLSVLERLDDVFLRLDDVENAVNMREGEVVDAARGWEAFEDERDADGVLRGVRRDAAGAVGPAGSATADLALADLDGRLDAFRAACQNEVDCLLTAFPAQAAEAVASRVTEAEVRQVLIEQVRTGIAADLETWRANLTATLGGLVNAKVTGQVKAEMANFWPTLQNMLLARRKSTAWASAGDQGGAPLTTGADGSTSSPAMDTTPILSTSSALVELLANGAAPAPSALVAVDRPATPAGATDPQRIAPPTPLLSDNMLGTVRTASPLSSDASRAVLPGQTHQPAVSHANLSPAVPTTTASATRHPGAATYAYTGPSQPLTTTPSLPGATAYFSPTSGTMTGWTSQVPLPSAGSQSHHAQTTPATALRRQSSARQQDARALQGQQHLLPFQSQQMSQQQALLFQAEQVQAQHAQGQHAQAMAGKQAYLAQQTPQLQQALHAVFAHKQMPGLTPEQLLKPTASPLSGQVNGQPMPPLPPQLQLGAGSAAVPYGPSSDAAPPQTTQLLRAYQQALQAWQGAPPPPHAHPNVIAGAQQAVTHTAHAPPIAVNTSGIRMHQWRLPQQPGAVTANLAHAQAQAQAQAAEHRQLLSAQTRTDGTSVEPLPADGIGMTIPAAGATLIELPTQTAVTELAAPQPLVASIALPLDRPTSVPALATAARPAQEPRATTISPLLSTVPLHRAAGEAGANGDAPAGPADQATERIEVDEQDVGLAQMPSARYAAGEPRT
ncbi:hypothetical protein Q5752_004546 [Cryptotrichosporon argae]